MFNRKVETVGTISEFIRKRDSAGIVKQIKKGTRAYQVKHALIALAGVTTIGLSGVSSSNHAYAAGPGEYVKNHAKEQIVDALMPLVDIIQALSYPIALVMLSSGGLMFMINQKDKGISLIQNASLGYVLVQLMPTFMKIIVGVGNSIGLIIPLAII
ncbi:MULTISPECIES: hypothetical protein [Bacillaceae]|uniref:hypothetical protein n=1 Tax=Bacillaceae TaxID=186817 RepID=UPI0010490050|nr:MULTISPECIES: hypothetical protein [Bacillaceae]TDB51759.1 hypothetical protein EPL02_08400 [Bacillus sp. CBEL-1]